MKMTLSFGVSHVVLLFITLLSGATASTVVARAGPPTNADILNLATDTFAVQLVGAQTTPEGVKSLCTDFDLSSLTAGGYNATSLKEIFCQASSGLTPTLPSQSQIRALTIEYSSWIWIFQAVGALKNDKRRLRVLCSLIDVPAAFSVGQEGTLVKDQICDIGNGGELPSVPLPYFAL
ncbi:MAG: hypothetical protein L6R39_006277 [Caloplaca ligustica]|nr:MAG: hypothetical protein L6R39_006277 [Caloplaca ligustica]